MHHLTTPWRDLHRRVPSSRLRVPATVSQLQDIISDRVVHVNGFKCRQFSRYALLGLIAAAPISLYSRSTTRLSLTIRTHCARYHSRLLLDMPGPFHSRNANKFYTGEIELVNKSRVLLYFVAVSFVSPTFGIYAFVQRAVRCIAIF